MPEVVADQDTHTEPRIGHPVSSAVESTLETRAGAAAGVVEYRLSQAIQVVDTAAVADTHTIVAVAALAARQESRNFGNSGRCGTVWVQARGLRLVSAESVVEMWSCPSSAAPKFVGPPRPWTLHCLYLEHQLPAFQSFLAVGPSSS